MRRIVTGLAVLGLALAGCGTEADGGNDGDGKAKPPSSSSPAAGGTSGLTWSYDEILDAESDEQDENKLSDVIATADDDVWVAGTVTATDSENPSPDDGFLLRYDGTRWQRQPMPAALGSTVHEARFDSLGADGFLLTASQPTLAGPRTVRWDGTRWTALPELPGDGGRLVDMKAFAADDVWALSGESRIHHWDGTRWSTSTLPATVVSLDGVATDDLWAVGHRDTGGSGDGGEFTQPAAVHWDGSSWQLTETPAYRFPEPVPPEPSASIDHVLAFAADDVRAYGMHDFNHGEVEDEPQEEAVRLRWDGADWAKAPDAAGDCAGRVPMAVDGTRGLFLDGNRYVGTDGACTKIKRPRLPSEGGVRPTSRQSLWLSAVEVVPGTDRVLGVGHVQVNQSGNPMSKSVIVSLNVTP
ncbi:hypothetical protein [Streptomyces phaeochromogenes]|uniref:hypothetical protein n=1 Tax=Streptomyces phaeochromogenes TaxID=1923 RepID=UPI00386E794C|nr:hypothetical protein OHB08_20850 [Streptomyces phaeochromogenes]